MASDDVLGQSAQGHLRSIVERAERLEAEKAEIAEHLKEVFAEAKGNGFDTKTLKRVIKARKVDRAKRQEEEAIFDMYMSALGELPLFATRGDGPRIGVTISTPDGGSVTAPMHVVQEALDQIGVEENPYERAKMIVLRDGKPSTSYIQRRMQIGYNLAASLIERMEAEGIVSPANSAGRREVLAQVQH